MMNAKNIELFKNISQIEYEGKWFDFHNDYESVKVVFQIGVGLILCFKEIKSKAIVSIKFHQVTIEKMEFFNAMRVENLTLDNLYRGKIEKNGVLVEYIKEEIGYFYLEFEEGQYMEFWSSGFHVEIEEAKKRAS